MTYTPEHMEHARKHFELVRKAATGQATAEEVLPSEAQLLRQLPEMEMSPEFREVVERLHAMAEKYCPLLTYFLFSGSPYFDGRDYTFPGVDPFRTAAASETHHICGSSLGAKRSNAATNTIKVCRVVHDWLERYSEAGFVLCVYHKCITGGLDVTKLEEILGGRKLLGLLENAETACEAHPWLNSKRLWMLKAFDLEGDAE